MEENNQKMFFKSKTGGLCQVVIEVGNQTLIRREGLEDYVVVTELNKTEGTWRNGSYLGKGLLALELAVSKLKKG